MVQYKKDKIKEKIDSVALTVFAEKGYSGTKISDIAQMAGISVGNIYRYYRSKNEIFHCIVPERFLVEVKNLLVEKISSVEGKRLEFIEKRDELWLFNNQFINFMVENRERMLIVFHNSEGTKYENEKSELVNFLVKTLKERYTEQYNQLLEVNKGDFVIRLIYQNLINMTLRILEETKDLEEVKKYLKSINSYHMFGITHLLK
jgi:AcrR family transcriptional regulator